MKLKRSTSPEATRYRITFMYSGNQEEEWLKVHALFVARLELMHCSCNLERRSDSKEPVKTVSASKTASFVCAPSCILCRSTVDLGNVCKEVENTPAVAPLVIVPGDQLNEGRVK